MARAAFSAVRFIVVIGTVLATVQSAQAVPFPESEPNSIKAEADPVLNMQPGDFLTGTTTGGLAGPGQGGINTSDFFLLQTVPQPPGIYRYQLAINTPGPQQHIGVILGLTQTGGVINPGTLATVQNTSPLFIPPRFNQWYGFGRGEQIYYSIVGNVATHQPYNCTLNRQQVTPQTIGPFREGQITISTVGQGHTTDTDMWVYDASLNPIASYGNDDEPNPGTTTQSLLTRNYTPGTYYLALTDWNLANDLASPPDDSYLNSNVMDFPGSAANSSASVNQVVNFAVTDGAGTQAIPATKPGAFDIVWVCFSVHSYIPPADDCWHTTCGETSFDFADTPIPCGFFDPGSEPFDGIVQLGGGSGGTDTTVRRLQSMTFGLSLPEVQQIPIELVALNLVSCQPITVRYAGGPPDEPWIVSVDLSPTPAPPGQLSVTKTHPNGGTFSSQFFVQPRFTFTRISDSAVRVIDTGAFAIPPLLMNSTSPAPWVHDAFGEVQPVCGVNFVPGVQEANVPPTPGSTCVSTVRCCKPVGHAGPGHMHVTGHICTPCPCGACCDPISGSCTELSGTDPAGACTTSGRVFKGIGSSCNSADGDTIPDSYETGNCCQVGNCAAGNLCTYPTSPTRADTDGDGLPDHSDPFPCNRCMPLIAPNRPAICDSFDQTLPGDGDCDNDGICDLCEIIDGSSHDANDNDIPDECESDCNGNGIPEDAEVACGFLRYGDMNCDGFINPGDIDPFVLALLNPAAYVAGYPACNPANADLLCDGKEDGLDIDLFVGCVLTGVCP